MNFNYFSPTILKKKIDTDKSQTCGFLHKNHRSSIPQKPNGILKKHWRSFYTASENFILITNTRYFIFSLKEKLT